MINDNSELLQLYPEAKAGIRLEGLYLQLRLHHFAVAGELTLYSNFISSLDGRIAVASASGELGVPASIANPRDWRLYQELAAQSDVMIISGRYFRDLSQGRAQDLLPVGNESEYADLLSWRLNEGLSRQPDLAIVSNSLDLPADALQRFSDRNITIFTGNRVNRNDVAALQAQGITVVICSESSVSGQEIRSSLKASGYRSAYLIAGPWVHRTIIAEQQLDLLFLTTRLRLLGGDSFATLLSGEIGAAADLQLKSLYLDQHGQSGQLFAQYALHHT